MKYFFSVIVLFTLILFASSRVTEAHVVVRPSEVGVGLRQVFTVSVPNEKEIPTTSVRLVIPNGIESVTPNVKPGWDIEVIKDGTGEDALVTEIIWSGGTIPEGQRDEFAFNSKVPSNAVTVQWKAYQTYADGTVVSWDAPPTDEESDDESSDRGPYSETKIIDDLNTTDANDNSEKKKADLALILSIVAVGISIVSITSKKAKK